MTAVQPIFADKAGSDSLREAARQAIATARRAQHRWAALPVKRRLEVLRGLRHRMAAGADELARSIDVPGRHVAESLVAEVLPLAEAIRFLERRTGRLLAPCRPGRRGRPLWLFGSSLTILREPLGVVLIIAPANYPLMLPGVQVVQALAAGNAVLVKPAPGHSRPVLELRSLLGDSGDLFTVLPEDPAVVEAVLDAGVDKVFLTGSAETGEKVLAAAAARLVPAALELSGHDAVFLCDDADLDLAARCIAYGRALNAGNTCIAPRRIFVPRGAAAELQRRLARLTGDSWREDVQIIPVADMEDALRIDAASQYHLGATVFGSTAEAERLSRRINAGCIVINDMIVPTADPRLPFGGRGRSGFGVTRGAEGLLEMTRLKAIARRGGSFRPHLDPPHPLDAELFRNYLAAAHGRRLASRFRAAMGAIRTLLQRQKP